VARAGGGDVVWVGSRVYDDRYPADGLFEGQAAPGIGAAIWVDRLVREMAV
jgi:hypothetical protein